MDATNGMSAVINMIIQGLTDCFSLLDNFTFSGISMLDFLITIFVIAAALPIIVAIVSSRSVVSNADRVGRSVRSRFRRGDE